MPIEAPQSVSSPAPTAVWHRECAQDSEQESWWLQVTTGHLEGVNLGDLPKVNASDFDFAHLGRPGRCQTEKHIT